MKEKDGVIGALIRYVDSESYIMIEFMKDQVRVRRKTPGDAVRMESVRSFSMSRDIWYRVKLDWENDKLNVWANKF